MKTNRDKITANGERLAWVNMWQAVGVLGKEDMKHAAADRLQLVVRFHPNDLVGDIATVTATTLGFPLPTRTERRIPFKMDDLNELPSDDPVYDVLGAPVVVRCRCDNDRCSGVTAGYAAVVLMTKADEHAKVIVEIPAHLITATVTVPMADVFPAASLLPVEAAATKTAG